MTDLISRAAVLDILDTAKAQDTFPDMIRRVEALPGGEAQCCMCGKTGLSVVEDGGPECELHDGRWVCGSDCWEMAARILAALEPTPPDDVSGGEIKRLREEVAGYREWGEDVKRLTRQLDVEMHGEEGAAKQASLCDLIGCATELRKAVRIASDGPAYTETADAWIARIVKTARATLRSHAALASPPAGEAHHD